MGKSAKAAQGNPPRFAPDGTTIPAHLREEAIDDDDRAQLLGRLAALQLAHPDRFEALQALCRQWRIPNLKSNRVTVAHGQLVSRLIDEARSDVPAPGPVEPQPLGDDPVPAPVYDDAPEAAAALEDQPGRYDPADGDLMGKLEASLQKAQSARAYNPDEEPF